MILSILFIRSEPDINSCDRRNAHGRHETDEKMSRLRFRVFRIFRGVFSGRALTGTIDAPGGIRHNPSVNQPRTDAANVVLYDDQCPLCTFQMKVLTWLDWLHVISVMPLSHPRAKELAPDLTREQLLEAIHCVTREGRIYRGARCIRYVGMRMPLILPLAIFLWLPGVIWVAEKVYAWISRNRYLLSRVFGCKDACAIMPARKREKDIV
jgi:predicted DCC family thiol-disulfide oxidoreductase YuxK